MYGFVVGALAVAWGVLVAYLDQAGTSTGRHHEKLCAGLLMACTGVTAAGGAGIAFGLW